MQVSDDLNGEGQASKPRRGKDARRRHDGPPKTRLLTLDDLDRRTKAAQRALELREQLVAERGGAEQLSVLRFLMTGSVAVLSAMVEDLQARWLRGEGVDPSAIATLLNARRREAEHIGIDATPRDVTPSLADYIGSAQAAESADAVSSISPAPDIPDNANRTSGHPKPAVGFETACNEGDT